MKKTEITPELIINARKEKTYCDGCKYIGEGTKGQKICYRLIAREAACAGEVKYWKCSYINKNNECKFYKMKPLNYKMKPLKKKKKGMFHFFLGNFFMGAGVVVIVALVVRLVWWFFSLIT